MSEMLCHVCGISTEYRKDTPDGSPCGSNLWSKVTRGNVFRLSVASVIFRTLCLHHVLLTKSFCLQVYEPVPPRPRQTGMMSEADALSFMQQGQGNNHHQQPSSQKHYPQAQGRHTRAYHSQGTQHKAASQVAGMPLFPDLFPHEAA